MKHERPRPKDKGRGLNFLEVGNTETYPRNKDRESEGKLWDYYSYNKVANTGYLENSIEVRKVVVIIINRGV